MTLRKFNLLWKRHNAYRNPPQPKPKKGKLIPKQATMRKETIQRVTIDQLEDF